MKILYKYATHGRPQLFFEILDLYIDMMGGRHEYEFIVSINQDDPSMNSPDIDVRLAHVKYKNVRVFKGMHADKIDAINADMQHAEDFDILVVVSDDMRPQIKKFDDIIVDDMTAHFPELDGALHYDDGLCGKDITITLTIMGKKLYNHFGYIYHPAYKSFYCDNEFTDAVRKLEKVKWIPKIIIKHCYFGFHGRADATYKMNSAKGKPDAETYARRKAEGFPK